MHDSNQQIAARESPEVIFISHSHDDSSWCSMLAESFIQAGFSVWIDTESMQLSDTIPQNVSRGLATSQYFVVVISSHSLASQWVAHEVDTALQRMLAGKMFLFVVTIEDIDPWPERFLTISAFPRIRFVGQPYDIVFGQLLTSLRQRQAGGMTRSSAAQDESSPSALPGSASTRLRAHQGPALCVRSSHNGRFIASGGGDGAIRTWERRSHNLLAELRSNMPASDWIRALAWSPDDTHIITAQDNGIAFVWDVTRKACVGEIRYAPGGILDIVWTDNGVGCITRPGVVGICLDVLAEPKAVWISGIQLPSAPLFAACWQRNNLRFAGAIQDGRIIIGTPDQRISTTIPPVTWPYGWHVEIRALQWCFNGTRLGALYANGRVAIWDSDSQSVLYDWETKQDSSRGLYWLGRNLIAVTDGSGAVKVWSLEPLQIVDEKRMPNMRILDVASAQDDQVLCIALATGDLWFS